MTTTPLHATPQYPNSFPQDAWKQVTVSAQDKLVVAGKPGWAQLEVTVTNHSSQQLDPAQGMGVTFSYRLLQADGKALAFECARTPLQSLVPAGASHTQEIQIIIPAEHLQETTAIRVGLLQLREFWVETINPDHAQIVSIHPGPELNPAQRILMEGSQLWPKGQSNLLKWPYNTMMVSEKHRLFYIPVAKCACTTLKCMMVELAEIPHHERAIKLDVHTVTDRFNTGVQLQDKPMDRARDILASDQYLKFSVVREPFGRLVSAYLEKFVHNRDNARNLLHTRQIIAAVQRTEDIDLRRSISFDEFICAILQQDSWDLDPHWRPQHLYMRGVPHIDRIFRIEDLGLIENYLMEKRGIAVELGHRNKTSKSRELLADASSYTADKLDSVGAISPGSFLSSPHARAIRDYFREDFELYEAAAAPGQSHTL